ncbi:MAG: hypothetical protein RI101_13360 [Nitrospira sp.]|jgi:hypothetical protein|nr:hypothetical protein [Nitrospira sp.]
MSNVVHRFSLLLGLFAVFVLGPLFGPVRSDAACGSVSCFVTIGSQQQVPQEGLLTTNFIYSYTPMTLPSGTTGHIAEADQAARRIVPNHHRELSTITNSYTFDANYGITDRLGIQLTVPYLIRNHDHYHWHQGADKERAQFSDKGIGDVRITGKYNVLPSLRSMLVVGVGVELPTGDNNQIDRQGNLLEPSGQLGRGQAGLVGSIYQGYELIPHRLNQFAYASFRHTFRNNDGYQYGDEYILNAGLNLVPVESTPWLALTTQLNYRYQVHDSMVASQGTGPIIDRGVPNTGSSWFGIAPGVLVSFADTWQTYFMAQVPLVRDANNNLSQGTTYTFGLTKYFQLGGKA